MAELKDTAPVYVIPDNYAEDNRILNGMLDLRKCIEAIVICVGIWFVTALIMPFGTFRSVFRMLTMVGFGGLALVGINGDPLSTVIKNMRNYRRTKAVYLYNPTPMPFYTSPADVADANITATDKLILRREEKKQRKMEEKISRSYVEGENFEFATDPTVAKYYDETKSYNADSTVKVTIAQDDSDLDGLDWGN